MYGISGTTRLIALLGNPVAHSVSPQMHNEAFRLLDLDYAYLAFDVEPKDFQAAIEGLKALNVRGFNLTMPFKASILPFLDELSPAARLSQSVNTVVSENGRLLGHTTDGIGYMRSLREAGHDVIGKKISLLGAGGAGTAICVQAALDGVSAIDLFERTNHFWDKAMKFSQELSAKTGCDLRLYDINDRSQLKRSISESILLTNATSLGMEPHADATPLPEPSFLFPELVVSDVIYHPRETLFLRQAKGAGCPTLNGLPMLIYQGAAAFQLWTGNEMPLEQINLPYK